MRKLLPVLLVLAVGILGAVSIAAATPSSNTDITINATATLPIPTSLEPCTHAPGTVTVTYNAVFHITDLGTSPTGSELFMIASTLTGSFVFVPTGASQPTYTGQFASNFQVQSTPPGLQFNTTNELIVVGTGSDGSPLSFREIAHVTSTPEGNITVSFDAPRCASN